MASSNTTGAISITGSVTFPIETTAACTNNEGKEDSRTVNDSSSAYLRRLSSDIPAIPDIPSPLLRPPKPGLATTAAVTTESNVHLPLSSASTKSNGHGK